MNEAVEERLQHHIDQEDEAGGGDVETDLKACLGP